MIPNKKKQSLFLEEFREHNPDKKMCWLWREKRQSVFICFYDVKAKKNFIQYLKQSVVPAFSMRIHDHGAFAGKECQGLGELAEIENALTEACGWHLILGNRVLIKCKKNRATEDKAFYLSGRSGESGKECGNPSGLSCVYPVLSAIYGGRIT